MQDNRDVLEKLQFSPDSCVLVVGAPDSYLELLSAKHPDLQVSTTVPEGPSQFDAVQIFVRNRMDVLELSPGAPAVLKKMDFSGSAFLGKLPGVRPTSTTKKAGNHF